MGHIVQMAPETYILHHLSRRETNLVVPGPKTKSPGKLLVLISVRCSHLVNIIIDIDRVMEYLVTSMRVIWLLERGTYQEEVEEEGR